jgi:16S rRNA (cytosine967-C5)-methyltransferase
VASAREVARRVVRRVEGEGAYVTLALTGELERSPLSPADRGLATELAYGVLRHKSRLDRALDSKAPKGTSKLSPAARAALRVAAYQLLFLDRVPAHAAVDDAVGAVRKVGGPRLAGFANRVLRRLADEGEPPLPDRGNLVRHLEVAWSTPRWILDELAAVVGADQLEAATAALARPAPLWAWLARGVEVSAAELLADDGARVEVSERVPRAFRVAGLGSPDTSPAFQRGAFAVQDLGAQLVAHLAAPRPGMRILDACAGVGGKSVHLADLADDRAHVDAVDLSARKLDLLGDSARRLGLTSIHPRCADLLDRSAPLADAYDLVVLDAPCSGLGVLRRHPEAKWRLAPADVTSLAELQAKLLDALAGRVAPGGALVYSVCTFTAREGGEQIARFLDRTPGFRPSAPPAGVRWDGLFASDGWLRSYPHRDDADGFFAARLERVA